MIRRFNYTGRKKIARSSVSVSLHQTSDAMLAFDAVVRFDEYSLPPQGKIFIEAYRRDYFRRFSCGTVANSEFPQNCVLERLHPQSLVMFRIKVVDSNGRILAVADRIMPKRTEDESTDKICLLAVDFVDLGHTIWRIDLTGDMPSLQLNRTIENIREIARSDDAFFTLVYPEVVRQILYKIVMEEDHTDPETDPDDWMSQWLNFIIGFSNNKQLPPSGQSEPVVQEKFKWIDEAVEAFCKSNGILDKFIHFQKPKE
ncbi:MAG: hypothetical protein ACOYVJ_02940 [Nitrospirota bacterium]